MSGINNLFLTVHRKTQGSLTIVTFAASLAMLLIGINLFIEDTYTSYMGLQEYQAHFELSLAIWPITYWSESLVPQIGQIVFFYVFFSDMKKNWWAIIIALLLLLVDFYADLYHRTQGSLSMSTLTDERTIAGGIITLFFFTVGAELFISMGWGISMTTFAPAINQVKKIIGDIKFSVGDSQPTRSGRSRQTQSVEDIMTRN